MKKRINFTIALALTAIISLALLFASGVNVLAEETYAIDSLTDFSDQCGHSAPGNIKTTRVEGKVADITLKTTTPTLSRVFYGSGSTEYKVDLSNFKMDFTVDQLSAGGSFKIAFMSDRTGYPMDNYGTGVWFLFADDSNANTSFEISGYTSSSAGQAEISGAKWWIRKDNPPTVSLLGETIRFAIVEDGDNLLVTADFEGGAVNYRVLIAKTVFTSIGLDYKNVTLFFTPNNSSNELILGIDSLTEPNTTAYLNSAARTNVMSKLDQLKTNLGTFTNYSQYKTFIEENTIDLNILRPSDFVSLPDIDTPYKQFVNTLLNAFNQNAETNFTPDVRNNSDKSYAEIMSDGKEKIILTNKFVLDGSSLGLKKTVDISDFNINFSYDKLIDTRFTMLFGPSFEAYNFGSMTIPGVAITFFTSGNGLSLFIENSAGAAPIDGVNTNEWHILKNAEGGWLTLPVTAGAQISLSFVEETNGDTKLTVTSGGQSAVVTIASAFFTGNNLDTQNMYLKFCAGHQANSSGTDKYLEFTINSISDASNVAAIEDIEEFLEDAEDVTTLEGAIALLEKNISTDMLYKQQTELISELDGALVTLRAFVNTEMTALANAFSTECANISDVSAGALTLQKINAAKVKQSAYYDKADYLDYLTVSQINAINTIVTPSDYKVTKAELYLKLNAYVAAANAVKTTEDISAAKTLREGITTADINLLEEADKSAVNTQLIAADNKVSGKEAELKNKKGCKGSATEAFGALFLMLASMSILFLNKKREN